MTHIDAMKQGLEALEVEDMACRYEKEATPEYIAKAITSLRQAIAEAEGQEKALQSLHNENERLGLYKDAYAEQEPVAWRTFDGEGGYDYRTYDTNEDYADEWEKRNPNHKGWVEPLYKDPKPCPTCEALARTVMLDQTSHDTRPQPQRTEQEPVGTVKDLFTQAAWERLDVPGSTKVYLDIPPQRKPLTEKRIEELYSFWVVDCQDIVGFARAVERTVKGEV